MRTVINGLYADDLKTAFRDTWREIHVVENPQKEKAAWEAFWVRIMLKVALRTEFR